MMTAMITRVSGLLVVSQAALFTMHASGGRMLTAETI